MGLFAVGDIIVIPFPFSDLSQAKARPALVIAVVEKSDLILLQITSKSYGDKYSFEINNKDLASGEIRFRSYVKYSKIFTANKDILTGKIGFLKNDKLNDIRNKLIELIEGNI
ncbi:type II toxin-antitoxin system PemK/MazF family toxin [Bacteroidota bacterium]